MERARARPVASTSSSATTTTTSPASRVARASRGASVAPRGRPERHGRRRQRARCRATRAPKNPDDFDNDYDAMRAALMSERARGFQPGIATTLNWLSEISFGARKTREKFVKGPLDALAAAYGEFLYDLPYRRQDGSLPPGGERTIEDAVRRLKRSEKARRLDAEREVRDFWRAGGETRTGFDQMAAEYTMALVMDLERGVIACEMEEDSRAVEAMLGEPTLSSLCEALERIKQICLCSSAADAAKMAYGYPELLLTSSSAIVARLSQLKTMIPGADVGAILRQDSKSFLQRDIPEIKERFRALRDAFPRVNVARLVEYDPSLLLLDVNVGLNALRELWTEEEFAQSDEDNPFFAEELSLAIKTLAGHGPERFGG